MNAVIVHISKSRCQPITSAHRQLFTQFTGHQQDQGVPVVVGWCAVGLAIHRSQVPSPGQAPLHSCLRQVTYTCLNGQRLWSYSTTALYKSCIIIIIIIIINRVTLCGRKITADLASHWPCVIDSVLYPATGWCPRLRKGDDYPTYASEGVWHGLPFNTTMNYLHFVYY